MWGKKVGAVALDPVNQYYVFAFEPKFRKTGIDLAPLKLPLASASEPVMFPELPELTYKRLPAFLADALPDDFGNALINSFLATKGIPENAITVLDRLAYMGNRAMGALEFKPARGPRAQTATAIELGSLVAEARNALRRTINNEEHSTAALRSIIEVGTSAGGARAKAVIAWNQETGEIRSGQAAAPEGFTHWLLKFDGMGTDRELGASQDYGRIEYAYHLMARAAGITMADCRLLQENGRAHFMTRRFDREDGLVKHHIQTLCAMAHLDYKKKEANAYAQLYLTIDALGLGYEALAEAYRRMVFNLMARNCDDHTKNFSFRLREGQQWELAPAYDITFAHNPQGEWTHQHLMSVNGKFKNFTLNDLLLEADRFGIGSAKSIIQQVRQAVLNWPTIAKEVGVVPSIIDHIQKDMQLLDA
jgi:serine/threonine-protein kinase HipA